MKYLNSKFKSTTCSYQNPIVFRAKNWPHKLTKPHPKLLSKQKFIIQLSIQECEKRTHLCEKFANVQRDCLWHGWESRGFFQCSEISIATTSKWNCYSAARMGVLFTAKGASNSQNILLHLSSWGAEFWLILQWLNKYECKLWLICFPELHKKLVESCLSKKLSKQKVEQKLVKNQRKTNSSLNREVSKWFCLTCAL